MASTILRIAAPRHELGRGHALRMTAALKPRASLVVSLWLKTDDIAAFEAFERAAAQVMAEHGGRIDNVVRRSDTEARDGPFEIHVVSFPDWKAFESYRNDRRFKELMPLREQLIARTEIWRGERREGYAP